MKLLTKWVCIALAVLFSLPCFAALVFADWYDEVSGGSYSPIIGEPYVAETFCGVEARYSLTTEAYQCNELIMRFYKEAYGLDVMAYINIGLVMLTDGYEFVTPSAPKKGDIIYSPAKFRQYKSDHWAIVKDYSNGKITLFEQNVKWNGKAGTGRQLNFPSEYYYLYTPVAKPGYPAPVLKGAPAASAATPVSQTQAPVTTAAGETSTVMARETSANAETQTEKAVTTTLPSAASTSPAESTSAAAESAKAAETSSAPVTQTAAETTAAKTESTTAPLTQTTAAASTAVSEEMTIPEPVEYEVIPVEETDIMIPEYEDKSPATATDTESATDTEPETEETVTVTEQVSQTAQEDDSSNKKYMLFVAGAAAFTVLAAAGVTFAALKKRR